MISLGKVISSVNNKLRSVNILTLGGTLQRTPTEVSPFGIDSNPIAGMVGVYMDTVNPQNPVLAGYVNISALAAPGENRMFSTDADGNVVFNVWQRADRTILMGASITPSDYIENMVRYAALNNALQSEVNALNAQLTLIQTAITNLGGVYTRTPITLDISAAKINEIKTQ